MARQKNPRSPADHQPKGGKKQNSNTHVRPGGRSQSNPIGRQSIRKSIFLVAFMAIVSKKEQFALWFLTYGPALHTPNYNNALNFANVPAANDLLQFHHGNTLQIFEDKNVNTTTTTTTTTLLLKEPETVFFDNHENMYFFNENGYMVSVSSEWKPIVVDNDNNQKKEVKKDHAVTADMKIVKHLGLGRPLAGKFTPDGKTLYIADAILGLTRITNIDNNNNLHYSKVELVASQVLDTIGSSSSTTSKKKTKTMMMTPILFADDVAIGPRTGNVYFTDATNVPCDRLPKRPGRYNYEYIWDIMYASKVSLLRGGETGSGRLLEYNPTTDEVRVLARDFIFANGVSVMDVDETALVVNDSFGPTIYKYHLTGEQEGQLEVLVASQDLPGYLDGIDCDWTTHKCYAVMPTPIPGIMKLLSKLPSIVSTTLRTFLLTLPRVLTPSPEPLGGIIEIDTTTTTPPKFQFYLDPKGKDVTSFTGVTVHKGKLYLGAIHNDYIGVYSLPEK